MQRLGNETKESVVTTLGNLSTYLHNIFIKHQIFSASIASVFTHQIKLDIQLNTPTAWQLNLKLKAIFELLYRVKDENEKIKETEFWKSVIELKKLFAENSKDNFSIAIRHFNIAIESTTDLNIKRAKRHKGFVQIGRSKRVEHGNDIIFNKDRTLSRVHLVITVDEGNFYIEDRSANGTFVNGKKIEKGIKLLVSVDDEIRIGREETLVSLKDKKIQELLTI